MQDELIQLEQDATSDTAPLSVKPIAGISGSLAMTEVAAAQLRAYLNANKLSSYEIFHCSNFDLNDVDTLLPALGESNSAWEAPTPYVEGGAAFSTMTYNDNGAWRWPNGFLRLFRHEAVIARWLWVGLQSYSDGHLWLIALPSVKAFSSLRKAVVEARRRKHDATWQVIGGSGETAPPRTMESIGESLLLNDAIVARLRNEVVDFFNLSVAELYQELGIPHRRGVLLHGPPGNGKTSLIRWLGASLPNVSALLLTPWEGFDDDELRGVIARWTSQAPAMLVLEDLDWLLTKVNVSTFLNMLDGIDTPRTRGGLMLVATTNHPEKLDPAINNRPGRFDAVIELPRPEESQRRGFIMSKLPALGESVLEQVVSISDGLSFAHLHEMLRLSGLRALAAGRKVRSDDDVLSAITDIKSSNDAATRGFPPANPEIPFGLAYLRTVHRRS